jgi:hypothetical protein
MLWSAAETKGYACPLWLTFKQALDLGGHVRKGESGELVVYANRITRTETDAKGEETEREIPFMKGYTVCQEPSWKALIHSRCNLWEKGEPNLLKLRGVQTFSVASSMTLYSPAPPDRILSRSPQVTACHGRDLAPRLNQSLPRCYLTTMIPFSHAALNVEASRSRAAADRRI